jgi:hypothetical protein
MEQSHLHISQCEWFALLFLSLQSPSRASFVSHSFYNLKRIGDKQHPCLTPLPVFTLLISPRFSRTLTTWARYKLLTNLLSRQLMPGPFRICINLVQLTLSNAFCQSMKQTHSSASISKVRSDIILSIPITSLVLPFPLLNPNWSSPSTSSICLSILLSIFATIFAVCAIRLIVRWSLHFVAYGFFFTTVIVTSVKSLGHSPVSYMGSSSW